MIDIKGDAASILTLLDTIPDPEVPAISIVELGVVRDILVDGKRVEVVMTPTYSGCPAMKVMEDAVIDKLSGVGYDVSIKKVYKPAWTTEWLSEETREKLRAYGIAPPPKLTFAHMHPLANAADEPVRCPFCNSNSTTLTSRFGSTACKALYFCESCRQPFEQFKCI